MGAKISGLKELEQNIKKLTKEVKQASTKAIRRGLNGAARSLEKSIKPNVPVLAKSTDFRQKGTIKNNVRHCSRPRILGNVTAKSENFENLNVSHFKRLLFAKSEKQKRPLMMI